MYLVCIYIAAHLHRVYLDWLQVVIDRYSRCTRKWWSSELGDTLRGRDWEALEILLEAVMEWTKRSTWRSWGSEVVDTLGEDDLANLEDIIEWVWRCTWKPWTRELGGMQLETVIERVWRLKWSQFADALGGHDFAILEAKMVQVGWVLWGGQWMACRVLRLFSLVSYLISVRMWQSDFTLELTWRAGCWWLIM